jgi:hypothetical protein
MEALQKISEMNIPFDEGLDKQTPACKISDRSFALSVDLCVYVRECVRA